MLPPRIRPESARSYKQGMTLLRSGRSAEAVEKMTQAVQEDGNNYAAYAALGRYHWRDRGDAKQSIDNYLRSIEIFGDNPPVLLDLAELMALCAVPDVAKELCDHTVRLVPNSPRLALIRSHIALSTGDHEAAEAELLKAVETDPTDLEYMNCLAILYSTTGNREKGDEIFRYLLQKDPGNESLTYNYGFFLTRFAPTIKGEVLLEYGFRCGSRKPNRRLQATRWRGDDLRGKSIIIWREQGIGDHIRFARLFSRLTDQAERAILATPVKLMKLFERTFPNCEIVPDSISDDQLNQMKADFEVPAGSIWHYLPEAEGDVTGNPDIQRWQDEPYLRPDPDQVVKWKSLFRSRGRKIRVGISWTSGLRQQLARELAYATLKDFVPLLSMKDVDVVCLQYSDCRDEIAEVKESTGCEVLRFEDVDLFDDLDAAAALTASLDAVVSVSNSVSDMASALNIPTMVIGTYGTGGQPLGHEIWPYHHRKAYSRGVGETWGRVLERVCTDLSAHFDLA